MGRPCRSPAMNNGRCRMHGGKSPGAPRGNSNAYRHGRHTAEAIAERRRIAALLRAMRRLVQGSRRVGLKAQGLWTRNSSETE